MRTDPFSLAGSAGRAANLAGVTPAASRMLPCALLAALILAAPAAASPPPPSAAALARATERLLEKPGFSASPRQVLRDAVRAAGESLFPDDLYITLYGAPQLPNTELGTKSSKGAAREIVKLASKYERESDDDAVPGFDLIGVVANSTPGPDRKYRTRQPDELIASYLERIRDAGGRLMLDIQPGRSSAAKEVGALEDWFAEPDVDAAIDPEWNVGHRGVPGQTTGSISANEINAASRKLDDLVDEGDLPPKVLVVHQFTKKMVRNRNRIKQRDEVQVVLNFDGIGAPDAKVAGYEALASRRLFNGFSIFLRLDTRVMDPAEVLGIAPAVRFLLYQ